MLQINPQTKIQHLYLRAGFGESFAFIENNKKESVEKLVSQLFKESEEVRDLQVVDSNQLKMGKFLLADKDEKREMIRDSIAKIKDLNLMWLDRMTERQGMLREKMTLFWHGHFACQSANVFFIQKQNNILRKHALGKFGDLLHAISKDPAMLQFLNNKQNRKDRPNENFAREVMELFTLGRGNYTEQDIKNAARAFTGWDFEISGDFILRRFRHDYGEKTFFGKTGKLEGEDILNMILENKQTAKFLTGKIYKYFVNENMNEEIVNQLATSFYQSDYDIGKLMREIFTSDWFYEARNIGVRIKSPIEYLTILRKQFNLGFNDKEPLLFLQKVLGQMLFYPPNVAGWKEGKAWIDSTTIVIRTQLPEMLYRMGEITLQPKEDGDVNTEFFAKNKLRTIKATYDWQDFITILGKENQEDIFAKIANYLFQVPIAEETKKMLLQNIKHESKEETIKNLIVAMVTLPEYQVC
ncbi:DUF1800 domain-containing protein [Thermoflexibacter ruber]|uniref:DUF1800 domain-containing protein n=1 Tax=Thermoflexibacter ruber TaxID=1003 RepID=A0A1I2FB85_9BACT|nr:DUF1800 domain-containing protein [Thermoflexibacter ruber]SFF02652.1 Protein of unknown function [Thermoflexibacter ruber]